MAKTQSQRIVDGLRGGPKDTNYFIDQLRIFNYTGRISELRRNGYLIEAKQVRKGLWRYTLKGEPK